MDLRELGERNLDAVRARVKRPAPVEIPWGWAVLALAAAAVGASLWALLYA